MQPRSKGPICQSVPTDPGHPQDLRIAAVSVRHRIAPRSAQQTCFPRLLRRADWAGADQSGQQLGRRHREPEVQKWNEVAVMEKGGRVELTVTNCGEGVDDSLAEKIMTPFFTSKRDGQGSREPAVLKSARRLAHCSILHKRSTSKIEKCFVQIGSAPKGDSNRRGKAPIAGGAGVTIQPARPGSPGAERRASRVLGFRSRPAEVSAPGKAAPRSAELRALLEAGRLYVGVGFFVLLLAGQTACRRRIGEQPLEADFRATSFTHAVAAIP
jgi:hypothetical protein